MKRAMAVKAVVALLLSAQWAFLDEWVFALSASLTLGAMIAFFAWVIVSPRSQFFVRSVFELPHTPNTIALTFDDGPDPDVTPKVLEVLARHGAKATFFVVGQRAEQYPDLIRRIASEGHTIGSHTYAHAHHFHFGPTDRMRAEVERGQRAVEAITGARPTLFRPPQGLRTPFLRDVMALLPHLICVTWSARGLDAMGRTAERIVARLLPALQPGAIITLHDGGGLGGTTDRTPTLTALPQLLATLEARGLTCVALNSSEWRAS
jgi:peptidoglycan/xylan/chitin deacetylase (PgdA/CDA1 family)